MCFFSFCCGLVWYGMVWNGLEWFGMGVVWAQIANFRGKGPAAE